MSNREIEEKINSCVKEIFFKKKSKILYEISNLSKYFKEYYLKTATELDCKVVDLGKYKLTTKELNEFNILQGSNLEQKVNIELMKRYKILVEEKVEYCIFKKNGLAEIYIKEEVYEKEKKKNYGLNLASSLYGIMLIIISTLLIIGTMVLICLAIWLIYKHI